MDSYNISALDKHNYEQLLNEHLLNPGRSGNIDEEDSIWSMPWINMIMDSYLQETMNKCNNGLLLHVHLSKSGRSDNKDRQQQWMFSAMDKYKY